jgi:hypothetical protein
MSKSFASQPALRKESGNGQSTHSETAGPLNLAAPGRDAATRNNAGPQDLRNDLARRVMRMLNAHDRVRMELLAGHLPSR